MKSKYSINEIKKIINSNLSVKEICQIYKISKSTVYKWKQLHGSQVKKDLNEVRKLNFKIKKLEKEKKIYCLSGCTPKSNLKDIILAIKDLSENHQYSIHSLCDAFEILRSPYYHRLRVIKNPTKTTLENEKIKEEILKIMEISKNRIGAKKIKIKLDEIGLKVSPKRISKLMKEMDVSSNTNKRRKRITTTKQEYKDTYSKNLLKQNFQQKSPNKIWVSDITQIKNIQNQRFYICVVIDLFSRKILSFHISEKNDFHNL